MVKRFALAGALLLGFAPSARAQTGLLVVAHGADSLWNQRVREVVQQVSWPAGKPEVAFLMGAEAVTAGWDAGVSALAASGAREIVVVPLMISSHGSHTRQIQHYGGALDSLPKELAGHDHRTGTAPSVPMRVTKALDGAPELVNAVVTRWKSLEATDRQRPIMLVAHGPNAPDDAKHWLADLNVIATGIRAAGLSADVRWGLLRDDAPPEVRKASVGEMRDTIQAMATRAKDSVVVMPVLVSTGIERTKLPRDFEGLPVRYTGKPLSPLPEISRWIERVAREALPRP